MSLSSLKETLSRPCTEIPSTSSSSSYLTQSSISDSQFDEPTLNPRKPPKTSISQQLLRIQDPFSPFQKKPPPEQRPPQQIKSEGEKQVQRGKRVQQQKFSVVDEDEDDNDVDGDDDGHDEREKEGIGKRRLDPFIFDHTGPYEPLLLSAPGEIPVIQVPASINCRLLQHQREGVKFLYKLYEKKHGGILGDDMGLGKTIQTIAFLAAVFGKDGDSSNFSNSKRDEDVKGPVLIICPTSVIHNWESEFSKWATFRVSVYHGTNRDLILDKLGVQGVEILITSFDTYRIHGNILSEVKWEVVIVDEAHRLKNEKSKLYQACLGIKTRNRYGLTGTIMQNKIMELFNLFDWVAPESLGTREHFREFYDDPLKQGQRSTAPDRFVQIADERKRHLATVLRKYLLRRTKEETIGHLMLGKEDNVVFCAMSEVQKRVYRRMLQQPEIQCLINKDLPCSCGSPLTQVECCKRTLTDGIIWNYLHRDNPEGCDSCPFCVVLPCLIKLQQISNHLELIKPNPKDDSDKQKKDAEFAAAVFGSDLDLVGGNSQNESFMGLSDVKHCGKMRALEKLLSIWISQGDKVLLFSHYVRILDILEKFFIRKGYCFSRLDGSTPIGLRQTLVDDFNSSPSKQVFLISTRAGGLGLNLVSANRVVIFDPNWNPSHDLQAQDRSFRFGQKRHVIVFRLLAAGSLEELVYTRQVYKQQLSNIAVSGKMEKRYFEGVQDCKEFQGELFGIHNLFRDLSEELFTSEIIELHGKQGKESTTTGSKQHHENEIEMHFNPSTEEEACESSLQDNELRKPGVERAATGKKPVVLEELGIVYTHRNEDVVNLKSGHATGEATSMLPGDDWCKPSGVPAMRRRRLLACQEDKKRQFGLVAAYMGMGEVEFSRWVLSATHEEREKALRDYYKKRRKEDG
ncbi:Swi5 complex subunit Swi2 [Dionaea muscipula]